MTNKKHFPKVPCNGCTICCENDTVFLYPEHGETLENYETEIVNGRVALKVDRETGHCVYLEVGVGCRIQDEKPFVCKEMDCRIIFKRFSKSEIGYYVEHGFLTQEFIDRAKKMVSSQRQKVTPRIPSRRRRTRK